MTHEEFETAVRQILQTSNRTREDKAQDIIDAAEDYAAGEIERCLHPPYRPPHPFGGYVADRGRKKDGTDG